ncbi:MAG TPA: hypothetical protein VHL31_21975, partial [Geminicoccus sp.]|uniref:hypothetical protein n=1 Tax=Geminicoccus sp. TaxID=2024832 RepID=UPI002E2EF360
CGRAGSRILDLPGQRLWRCHCGVASGGLTSGWGLACHAGNLLARHTSSSIRQFQLADVPGFKLDRRLKRQLPSGSKW